MIGASESLTYRDLDLRANRLARELDASGSGAPRRVGICLERGPDLVVALLATLKAGAAYVPLDPDLPAERLSAMLADASVALVLTDERLSARLPAGAHRVVCIDRDALRIAQRPGGAVGAGDDADDLACVMYTSARPAGRRAC
ncbi:MAG: AMP-binding protein [Betaproteobacteria bacterium]|nr:AMP-binding protein [Betaproteobacteria bacterium]